jgi:putative restriction endonuclease
VSNCLLLRVYLHKLFGDGCLSITPDLHVEVSRAIKEEFHNGKIYYALQGKSLVLMPGCPNEKPDRAFLDWHNENVFKVS